MSERGVFAVDRGIWDHPMFAREPFTEREVWLWMVSSAAWAAKRVRVGRAQIELQRGQLAFATRFLAEKWRWAHSKVVRFLKRLEIDTMVSTSATREATLITICNYDKYAFGRNASETQGGTRTDTSPEHPRNKEKELKKDNNQELKTDQRKRAESRRATRLPADAVASDRNISDATSLGMTIPEIEKQWRRMRDWSASAPRARVSIGMRAGETGVKLSLEAEMATELAIIEPIKLPDPRRPATLPSLPAWLRQRSAALASAVQPDSRGKYRSTPTLPKEMILSSSERALVQRHIDDLEHFTRLDQPIDLRGVTLTSDQAHGVMIASLLLKGGAKLDQQSSYALTEDYLDAIEDLPAWMVREAIRKWNRAESHRLDGKPHNYDFRPSPPTLRRLALHEIIALRGRMLDLQKICDAQEMIEYTDEYRNDMLERLANMFKPQIVPSETEGAT